MKNMLLPVLVFCLIQAKSQTPSFEWAVSLGASGPDNGSAITCDDFGNIYVTGSFSNSVDFDQGPGEVLLTSNGDGDVFVLKMDGLGKLLWAKSFGGNNTDGGKSITVDRNGNVFVAGTMGGRYKYDPRQKTLHMISVSGEDIFVQKLDPKGNVKWIKSIGGKESDLGKAITSDANGNIYVTGFFEGTVDFDPGQEVRYLTAPPSGAMFVLAMNTSGALLWANAMVGKGWARPASIASDSKNNLYLTGSLAQTVDFDPGPDKALLTSTADVDIFILKLDVSGNLVWAKSMAGTTGGPFFEGGLSIATDLQDQVYLTGFYSATVDFDPGPGTTNLSVVGETDIFIQKLDSDGNLVWAQSVGGYSRSLYVSRNDVGRAVTTDNSGNVYVTGLFEATADFDPGEGQTQLTAEGYKNSFILKLDSSGELEWAASLGGGGSNGGSAIACDDSGNVYVTGFFKSRIDFDPGPDDKKLISAGSGDIYILKLKGH